MHVAIDMGDVFDSHPRQNHQLKPDRQKIFADDMQIGFRQQMMDISHPSGEGIIDRDHGKISHAIAQRRKSIEKCLTRQRLHLREHIPASRIRIGAIFPLKGNFTVRFIRHFTVHSNSYGL